MPQHCHPLVKNNKRDRCRIIFIGLLLGAFHLSWADGIDTPNANASLNIHKKWTIPYDLDSPENEEESFREAALEESEHSFRARRFSFGEFVLERSRVFDGNHSGMFTFAQIEIPFYQGRIPLRNLEIAQFERKGFHALRKNIQAERWVEFQKTYFEAVSLQEILSIQKDIEDVFSELVSRGEKLVGEQLRAKDENLALYRESLLNKANTEKTKARLNILLGRLAYYTGEKGFKSPDLYEGGVDDQLTCEEDFLSQMRNQLSTNNPDILILLSEIEKQVAKIRLAKSERFPELLATFRHTHDPRFIGIPNQTFAGIRFEQKFSGFGSVSHKVHQEELILEAQNQRLENTRRRLLLRFDEAVQTYKASYELWKSQESFLILVHEIMNETTRRYERGEASWKQSALAKIDYLRQSREVKIARVDVQKSRAEIMFFYDSRVSPEATP